jgi:hypothetical protein
MRIRLLPVIALVALSSRPAAAQLAAVSPVSFSVFAGADIPRGTSADALNTGYIVGGAADLHIPLAPIGFRGEVTYASFGAKGLSSGSSGNGTDLGVNLDAVFGVFNLLVASPYLIAGGSYSRLGSSFTSGSISSSSPSENHYGFNAGVGVDLPLGVMAARVDVRYKQINTSGDSFKSIPITFGIRF